MSLILSVPNTSGGTGTDNTFVVINASTIEYNGVRYGGVSSITYPDGSVKTCSQLIDEAGGVTYSANELKRCFKVEGYDPDANNASWFTVYSNNSRQTSKNETAKIPGSMWCERFDFTGTVNPATGKFDNYIMQMFADAGALPSQTWIGFKLGYGTAEVRSYCMTYRDDFAQESVPCPPVTVDATFMHNVKISGLFKADGPVAGHYYVPIRDIRLWRTAVGSDGAVSFRRVAIDPVSVPNNNINPIALGYGTFPHSVYVAYPGNYTDAFGYEFRDNVREEDLTVEVLASTDWDPPPFRQSLQLVSCWNGMLSWHRDNIVAFCEPYRPHAWPAQYQYALPFNIIGKAVEGREMIVTTTGPAYVFTGAHPSSMNFDSILNTQAGKPSSKVLPTGIRAPGRAICATPGGVCYACDDGIIISDGGRSRLLTERLFTKEEWKQRYGSLWGSMRFAYSNGKLVAWFYRNATAAGFVLTMDGSSLTEYLPSPAMCSAIGLPGSDGLYVIGDGSATTTLRRFEDANASRMVAQWKSKKVVLPHAMNFGCCQLVGSGVVTVLITAGNRTLSNANNRAITLTDGVPSMLRLDGGFREREWTVRFQLAADAVLREFYLATTPQELNRAPAA